jgi:hypothetical protein
MIKGIAPAAQMIDPIACLPELDPVSRQRPSMGNDSAMDGG